MNPDAIPATGARRAIRAADALRDAAYHPLRDPADYAETLHRLHDALDTRSVIGSLQILLERLATAARNLPDLDPDTATAIAGHLERASDLISGAACDHIDRARALLPEEGPR